MPRLEDVYFLGIFVVLSVFTSWLRAEEPAWISQKARAYRLIEDEGTDRETFIKATVYRMQDGKYYVAVWAPPPKREWECDGIGELEKDDWIHFSWTDNFSHKGTGAVRFLDHGTKLAVKTNCNRDDASSQFSEDPWILPWTREPVLMDARTTPHGYLIHLPTSYENSEGGFNYLTLMPQSGGKVKIVGRVNLAFSGNGSDVFLKGTGSWKNDDRLDFPLKDNQTMDRGEGSIRFLGPDKVVLTLSYTFTRDPTKKAEALEFNAKKLPLLRNRNRTPWEIAGVGEEMEE